MNSKYDIYQIVVMAMVSCMTGGYAIWAGISVLKKENIKISGPYKLGAFISNVIRGKAHTSKVETDLDDPKIAMRYGIFWLLIGFIFLAGGVFILFAK
jgi:hypothetical protein